MLATFASDCMRCKDEVNMPPAFTFCETSVVKANGSSRTFVCPTMLRGRAEAMRADWPRQEIVYSDGRGDELMRVAIDQMPVGLWMW
jgi:hypothetical protein